MKIQIEEFLDRHFCIFRGSINFEIVRSDGSELTGINIKNIGAPISSINIIIPILKLRNYIPKIRQGGAM